MALRAATSWFASGVIHVAIAACLSAVAVYPLVEPEWEVLTRSGGAIVITMQAAPPEEQPPAEVKVETPTPPVPLEATPVRVERVTLDTPIAKEFAPPQNLEAPPQKQPLPVTDRTPPAPDTPKTEVQPPAVPRVARQTTEQALETKVTIDVPQQLASAVGSQVSRMPKQLSSNVHPPYPADAIARNEAGRVMIRATIAASGEVSAASVHASSGSASLDRAALEAVLRWKFSPAQRDGRSVAHDVLMPIDFILRDR